MMTPLHLLALASFPAAATFTLTTAFTTPALSFTHRCSSFQVKHNNVYVNVNDLHLHHLRTAPIIERLGPGSGPASASFFELYASTLDSPRNKAESEFENNNENDNNEQDTKKRASFLRRLANTFRQPSSNKEEQPQSQEPHEELFETHTEEQGSLSISTSTPTPTTEKPSTKNQNKNTVKPPNLFMAKSVEEYKILVAQEKEQLTVVRWYATYCRACKAVQPSFYRLAETYPNVKFVEVPCNKNNVMLHQGLGVPTVPYAHIYHPEAGLVEELKMSKKHFRKFHQHLTWHVQGSCETPDGDSTNPHALKDEELLEPRDDGTVLNFE